MIAEFRKVIIVGDSIIKDMSPIDGVIIKSFPGVTISKLAVLISKRQIQLDTRDYIILHVGTNNIGRRDSFDDITSDYGNLIATIRKLNPSIHIIVSAIIPRPVDHIETDSMIRSVNKCLKDRMSIDMGFHFVCTYKAVSKFGTFRRYLYAKLDRGLHLNTEGSSRLRHFFIRVISTID